MALTEEWKHRIERWQAALANHCYRPLGAVKLRGFITTRQLTEEEAREGAFQPMPAGTPWGAWWEYGWFAGELSLPPEAEGKWIVIFPEPGGESLVWVNGKIAGSCGWAHKDITLARPAEGGERFSILIESYAGHGPELLGKGPLPYGKSAEPEHAAAQRLVGSSTYGVWLDEVNQLAIDFTTLFELRGLLDPLSLRVAQIDEALMETTLLVDLELPDEEMLETVRAGQACLCPLLEATNGSSVPELFTFGHAHLDVAWLWPLAETERKIARTTINQLNLFEEYPEYRFIQSQPHLYRMLQQHYPELYQRLVQAVREGHVIADGGMWVEADTNISGGEALIRQILYGRRFFKEELGVESTILWLPDVFGYSGALPQILAGCEMEGFATQKITWAYNGGDPFPYNTFWWQGIDGTAIPAHIFTDYGSDTKPSHVMDRWKIRLQKNGIHSMIYAFGHSDGGGGPTRNQMEFLRRARDLEGLPRVRMSSPAEFFTDLKEHGLPKERYVGELYFQAHRGTFTAQARTKRGNRKSEFALREAELWASAAAALQGFDFGPRSLEQAWTALMLNQFHDILPGSSIQRVYVEAEAAFTGVIEQATALAEQAAARFIRPARAATVFNSLSWPRRVLLEFNEGSAFTEVTVPACGWASISEDAAAQAPTGGPVTASSHSLENSLIHASFNSYGELVSLWDKEARREVLAAPGNIFHLYKDVPDRWDAWDIDSMAETPSQEVPLNEAVEMEVLQSDPLCSRLRLRRKLHGSSLEQVIRLRHDSRTLEFETTIDWHEMHRLLKVNFPVAIHADEALHEIQFGHLRRPTHASRPYDADRFEVSAHKWSALAEENRGVALLNDCKYGLSVKGNSLNLTLLKASIAPDTQADQGVQHFTYALYSWNGSFFDSRVVQEAYELNVEPLAVDGEAQETSLLQLDAANIVLEAVKPAEDGSGDLILRLYESKRGSTRRTLSTILPFQAAWETDMLESPLRQLLAGEGKVELEFRPFEIKTVRLVK